MQDEVYKSQDPVTQVQMLDKLRIEKTRIYESGIYDKLVGFTQDEKDAEDRSQYNKASSFRGLPGKDYIVLGGYKYEISPETKQKYDEYFKEYSKKVKEMLESGYSLN